MGLIETENEKTSSVNIPIIDFSSWSSPNTTPEARLSIAKDLADACHNVGFVSIINHGVPIELLDEAFAWSKKLFDLKTEEKMLAPHPDGPTVHRGYSWPGLEKVSQVISEDVEVGEQLRAVTDCKESYEIGSESNPEQPNVWLPSHILPGFHEFMTKFYWTCNSASLEILKAIGLGMGLSDPSFVMSTLHRVTLPPAADRFSGEERMTRARYSIPYFVSPDIDAVIECMKECSSKENPVKYEPVVQREVTLPPAADRFSGEERMTRARYSIPYFVSPDIDAVIECMKECSSKENPVKYEPVVQREYRLMRAKLQYRSTEAAIAEASG
ncbi:related to isopenicillin N synthase and related dioxygenases [Phialocephala subalpina]|uniref:Related to isopenicillin N synthase and related dioxygenases n=1 Tax=Phialocephala subalpina TaxID=576137 RepID=A0A1L7X6R3_9HELO|nr:related to isopenicillin N synthase and related dioxygenases [Phialocephala subalpina]